MQGHDLNEKESCMASGSAPYFIKSRKYPKTSYGCVTWTAGIGFVASLIYTVITFDPVSWRGPWNSCFLCLVSFFKFGIGLAACLGNFITFYVLIKIPEITNPLVFRFDSGLPAPDGMPEGLTIEEKEHGYGAAITVRLGRDFQAPHEPYIEHILGYRVMDNGDVKLLPKGNCPSNSPFYVEIAKLAIF